LKVNTKNRKGKLNQSATIFSNDPQKPTTKISISGFIKQFISVEPSTIVLLQGYYGDKIVKKVTITSPEDQLLKITDITTDIDDKIQHKLNTIEKEKEYSLEIKTPSGIRESFQGKVVLKTNIQKKPEIELFVTGRVKKEVNVSPPYLYFGIIDTKKEVIDPKSLTRTVMVSRAREGGLSIKKIELNSNWITTEIETSKKGEKYSVIIILDKDNLPKGKFREKVTIHTEYDKRPEAATIIIDGKVI